jgi:hypothetical protein
VCAEAEESPLLEAFASERLVKAYQVLRFVNGGD